MKILLIGMNHRTAPVETRERFAAQDAGPLLRKLSQSDEIGEALLVSTCNRVELVVATQQVDDAILRMHRFFRHDLQADETGAEPISIEEITYEHREREAVRHVFRVASSLDSMVVGEPQILGQMKDAYRLAVESESCGPVLARLFQRAFAAAKRVKNETRIAQRPVSVARVAVELAGQIFENFAGKRALLIGAGEMIELALFALQREGLRDVRVVNRTLANAEELAGRFNATPHPLDDMEALLADSDVVLSCVGGERPPLHYRLVKRALAHRRSKPAFFIDLGVPRNVEARVEELDNAYVYDMDDLQSVAASNVGERRRESESGERIVVEEQTRFDAWLTGLRAVPTIRHLRARAAHIRESEVDRMAGRLSLDEAQREGVQQLTRAIVNKLLHAPLAHLRSETEEGGDAHALEAARALFGLDDEAAPGAEADVALREETERSRLGEASVNPSPGRGDEEDEVGR